MRKTTTFDGLRSQKVSIYCVRLLTVRQPNPLYFPCHISFLFAATYRRLDDSVRVTKVFFIIIIFFYVLNRLKQRLQFNTQIVTRSPSRPSCPKIVWWSIPTLGRSSGDQSFVINVTSLMFMNVYSFSFYNLVWT